MDRRWSLLAVLLLLPVAGAQTEVLTDASGDAEVRAGGAVPASGVNTAHIDMIALHVEELAEAFRFHLAVDALDQDNPTFLDSAAYHVDLQHRDVPYRLQLTRSTLDGTPSYDAWLMVFDSGRGSYVHLDRIQLDIDSAGGVMTAEVPRDWLLDGNGTAPSVGRLLTYLRAYAQSQGEVFADGFFEPVEVTDAMPDSGFGEHDYPVQLGLAQSGDARLRSDDPVRASNGEKGTFVFYVDASNLAETEQRFELRAVGVPEGWEVTLPSSVIRIEANVTRTFPVLVAIPFQHQHGAFEAFTLEMQSQRDPGSVGRQQIGIRYLAIPQPAGHHDRLYLHAREVPDRGGISIGGPPDIQAYMNTIEQDEAALDADVPPREANSVCCPTRYTWRAFLEPGLQMGLDFDRNRTGDITVQFDGGPGVGSYSLEGRLLHVQGDPGPDGDLRGTKETVLADLTPTSPQTIGTGTAFEAPLQPTKASDLVPYTRHAALVLELELVADGTPAPASEESVPMLTGGQMTLPLNEYRDPIDDVFNGLVGLAFQHDGPAQRKVNPGDTVLFNMTLYNDGAVDDVFTLRLNGTNAAWGRILGDDTIFVGTGASRSVVVAVSPPEDAPDGDIVDLIVTAASQAEPTAQGNIRIVAIIDAIVDHPDESHLVKDLDDSLTKKKSPGLPAIVGLVALLGLARLRRRR